MVGKVKIELGPYSALAIVAFLREYINDEVKDDIRFKAIYDAVDEYEKQVFSNITREQFEDANIENSVNKLTGKWPKK